MKDLTNKDVFNSATEQEVFDFVAHHLLTQKERSEAPDESCRYRSKNNLKCAAGCLISDTEYDDGRFEGIVWKLVAPKLDKTSHTKLISDLQMLHDEIEVCYWKPELLDLADEFKLSPAILEQF